MVLLGAGMAGMIGCHAGPPASALVASDHARIYAAVLRDVTRDTTARWVVLDTLLPTTDIEADQYDMVRQALSISESDLRAFLTAQRLPTRRVVPAMLPDLHWRLVSVERLDSLRAIARGEVANGTVTRGARNDHFWRLWYRAFPASGGYVAMSPASISANGAFALVQVRIACGPMCGESELRLLRRDASGMWRTTDRVRLSES